MAQCQERIDRLVTTVNTLEQTIEQLQSAHNDLEQYGRGCGMRFYGIPENAYENTDELVTEIPKKLGVQVHETDIYASHSVGKKLANRSRPLIVRFLRYKTR
ncbi:unnamed protein product, partial [Didymodactylos carnosus]